jgi:glutamyl-Q tRNA(Asp) synthetase
MVVTRFAPSPNGLLHLGHAYAALVAEHAARAAGGRFLLRIEDIDRGRARPEFEAAIYEDLAWLGLEWARPVRRQSEHFDDYRAALARLEAEGLVYPCFCTRAEIAAEVARSQAAPHGPEGALYPGTCRALSPAVAAGRRAAGEAFALRLDVVRARAWLAGARLVWREADRGEVEAMPERLGDVVLARKDAPTSYHLAVTVDDQLQGVSLVTRGEDLFHATHVHRLLQALLGYEAPAYRHHKLILDVEGRRLAKRDRAATLADLRARGTEPADVRRSLGFA